MKEASNRPIPVQAENGAPPSPSPEGAAVRQPGTLYGYVRTSRQQLEGAAGMNPETQARALEAAGVCPSDLYRDLGLSGTTASTSRAGWRALQGRLRPGDTVVVVELARIGRCWTEAVNTIRQLRADGVRFRSLAESESTWSRYLEADEDSPDHFVGTIMLLFGAWAAQQELEAVRRRTLAGLDRARAEGKHLGRPHSGTPQLRDLAAQLRLDGRSYGEIARTLGIARSTVQGWLRVP